MKNIKASFLSKEKSEKIFVLALIFLVFLGILFRARHYLAGRSLWLDEAMLALDILHLSFRELTQQPLPYQQGAPIGFLFFLKTATLILGDSEYVFRLYSFFVGIAALLLMAILAKRYLHKAGALISLALFASNLNLVYYSAESKQYMGDVAATLILLFLLEKMLEKDFSRRTIFTFSFVNIVIIWFSHASVFVVAAVGIVLTVQYALKENKQAFSFAFLNLALSGVSASLLYWFHLRPLSGSDFLRSFWEVAFVPLPLNAQWFGKLWENILQNPLGLNLPPAILFLLFLFGVFFLWQHERRFSLTLILVFIFTFLASILQKYPLAERMLLFSTPIFFFFFGAGVDFLYFFVKSKKLSFSLILLLSAYLLYAPFSASFDRLKKPLYREHIRPSMEYLRNHLREDDQIYVYYYADPAFLFYLPKFHLEDSSYFLGDEHQENPNCYLREIDKFEGRVWFLFSHVYEDASINEEEFIVTYLDKIATKKREYRISGSSVSLYLYILP